MALRDGRRAAGDAAVFDLMRLVAATERHRCRMVAADDAADAGVGAVLDGQDRRRRYRLLQRQYPWREPLVEFALFGLAATQRLLRR